MNAIIVNAIPTPDGVAIRVATSDEMQSSAIDSGRTKKILIPLEESVEEQNFAEPDLKECWARVCELDEATNGGVSTLLERLVRAGITLGKSP
jgi:hypothetical protein